MENIKQVDKSLKLTMMIQMMEVAYATMLRQIIINYTEATENKIDDRLVAILDGIFGYKA